MTKEEALQRIEAWQAETERRHNEDLARWQARCEALHLRYLAAKEELCQCRGDACDREECEYEDEWSDCEECVSFGWLTVAVCVAFLLGCILGRAFVS